jgi:hypothetical protein
MRILMLLLVCLSLLVGGNSAFEMSADGCTGSCPSDVAGNQCPPLCNHCACCTAAPALAATTLDCVPTCGALHVRSGDLPESIRLTDVFHVPRLLVA